MFEIGTLVFYEPPEDGDPLVVIDVDGDDIYLSNQHGDILCYHRKYLENEGFWSIINV